jgi:uncharacterized membrane protein YfcA
LIPDFSYWLIYLVVGVFVGFFAGLLGIGGGSVIVPVLSLIFIAKGYPAAHVIHMALGTSLAAIIIGSFSGAREHHLHKAVNWQVVRAMTPGILLGTFSGAVFAYFVTTAFLKYFFVGFIGLLALQLIFDFRPQAHRNLPGAAGQSIFGFIMGWLSSLAGIGGAVLTITYMTWCNVKMHEAIGTASAIGFPIAVAGTLGYMVTGLAAGGMPQWSLGYVYLPAWLGISLASYFIAPLGARLAHRLPVKTLKKIFMLFLVGLAVKMAVSV